MNDLFSIVKQVSYRPSDSFLSLNMTHLALWFLQVFKSRQKWYYCKLDESNFDVSNVNFNGDDSSLFKRSCKMFIRDDNSVTRWNILLFNNPRLKQNRTPLKPGPENFCYSLLLAEKDKSWFVRCRYYFFEDNIFPYANISLQELIGSLWIQFKDSVVLSCSRPYLLNDFSSKKI